MNDTLFNKVCKDLDSYMEVHLEADQRGTQELITKGYDEDDALYGSTPYATFKKVVEQVKLKPKRRIVIGVSFGRFCFYWKYLSGGDNIGFDIHHTRIAFGKNLIADYQLSGIELNVMDVNDFNSQEGDVIWSNITMCNNDFSQQLLHRLLHGKQNIAIISYGYITLDEYPAYKYMDRIIAETSWIKAQPFHIYEKCNGVFV